MRLTVAVAMDAFAVGVDECCCCSEAVSGLSRLLKPRWEAEDDM